MISVLGNGPAVALVLPLADARRGERFFEELNRFPGVAGRFDARRMVRRVLATGPFDVSMFSMRQRRTDPAWYGRAFAVSMGLNWAGQPIGSAISGPLIHTGLTVAFLVAAAFMLLAAGLVRWVIPAEHAGTISSESARQSRRDRPVEESPSSAEQGAG